MFGEFKMNLKHYIIVLVMVFIASNSLSSLLTSESPEFTGKVVNVSSAVSGLGLVIIFVGLVILYKRLKSKKPLLKI